MIRFFVSLFFLFVATASAEEQLFVPRNDFVVETYNDLANVKVEIWETYSDRKTAAYEVRQQKESVAYEQYEEYRLEALDSLSKADWENYTQWLDAKERHDYGRQSNLEVTVPALQKYLAEHDRIYATYQKVRDSAKLQYEKIKMEADHVKEIEELNAEQAFQLQKN